MVYRAEDLMGFGLVTDDEWHQGIECQVCGARVVVVEFGQAGALGSILDPCVEHRRTCPESGTWPSSWP